MGILSFVGNLFKTSPSNCYDFQDQLSQKRVFALDNAHTNMMLADNELRLIYLNQSLKKLFQGSQKFKKRSRPSTATA